MDRSNNNFSGGNLIYHILVKRLDKTISLAASRLQVSSNTLIRFGAESTRRASSAFLFVPRESAPSTTIISAIVEKRSLIEASRTALAFRRRTRPPLTSDSEQPRDTQLIGFQFKHGVFFRSVGDIVDLTSQWKLYGSTRVCGTCSASCSQQITLYRSRCLFPIGSKRSLSGLDPAYPGSY